MFLIVLTFIDSRYEINSQAVVAQDTWSDKYYSTPLQFKKNQWSEVVGVIK